MHKYLGLIIFILSGFCSFGQLRFSEAEVGITSQYIWRGTRLGDAPVVMPSATWSGNKFSFNVWSAFTFNNSYSELDLTPSYQFKHFQASLMDYYLPTPGESNDYLNFKKGESCHALELTFDNSSVEKARLKWMIATFLLGDRNEDTGKPFYSTYLEVSYPFSFRSIDAKPVIGMTPFKGTYADEAGVVNLGMSLSKELSLSKRFSIPLSASAYYNPYRNDGFFTVATGIYFSRGE